MTALKHMYLSVYDLDELLELIIPIWHNHLLGGITTVMNEGVHTIMFTICKGKAVICNYGECLEKIEHMSDMHSIQSVSVLRLLVQTRI